MRIGSLFSGIGGIEYGFEQQGFTTAWFIEYEPYAREILKKRFPKTPIYGDITEIDFRTVPKIDILTGGFPCQDISNAGKRVGIEGSRSSLWKYYYEAIRILRPKYAIIENVSALTNRGLNVVLADLAKIGYDAEWYNISASSVGALHKRERIFIISYPHSISKKWCFNGEYDKKNEWNEPNRQIRLQNIRVRRYNGQWTTEPGLGRVAHGISNRMDRIKCLGNAVVPQVAEVIAKAIKTINEEVK